MVLVNLSIGLVLLIALISIMSILILIYRKNKVLNKQLFERLGTDDLRIAKTIIMGNFPNFEKYIRAKELGASNIDEYNLVLEYGAPDYYTVQKMLKIGITEYSRYKRLMGLIDKD